MVIWEGGMRVGTAEMGGAVGFSGCIWLQMVADFGRLLTEWPGVITCRELQRERGRVGKGFAKKIYYL